MKIKDMDEKERIQEIRKLLKKEYPKPTVALNFSNPLEMLIATILSAQATDVKVNEVTKDLFKKYKTAHDYAEADRTELENDIRPTGFYRNKAKYLQEACKLIIEKFDGNVPNTMEGLISLPGVARKTANIVISNAFGKIEGIAVDTHVKRLSQRLGLTKNKNPDKIEQDLMAIIPKKEWFQFTYMIIDHGRKICHAKKPEHDKCVVRELCPSADV
ncbi:endonuclease III [Candidatus Borrarchaeum sp.]|uniref:endonuclease III n=1 Tax=Candidatus Borrarchaeum sp. TaxID=2846742 RepID=UPI00258088D0|nr:endonuclease III [Candidatus Borrarchaeum sp.]